MKKSLLVGLIAVAIIPIQVGAYGVETHAAITLEIARFFNQHYPDRALTLAEMKILADGAIDEDDGLRMLNHFYDPVHRTGLPGQLASKAWVQNSVAQAGIVNNALALVLGQDDYDSSDYTWKRAVEDYARGKKDRGLEGLGHVLHLIEDLTVPAHVRNDPHPPKDTVGEKFGDDDPYELWSHKFNTRNINILVHLREKKPISGLGSLNKYFDELATYTNSRLFSKDTIYEGEFLSPSIAKLSIRKEGDAEFLFSKDSEGIMVLGKRKAAVFSQDASPITTDSDIISQSTWDRLSLKAVQYGAGVIDLFFNEVEKLKKDPKFKITEQKSLLGQFIDAVGENVGALVEGAPKPQPVVVSRVDLVPVAADSQIPEIGTPTEAVSEIVPVLNESTAQIPEIAPEEPIFEKVVQKNLTRSGGGGGGEEPADESAESLIIEEPPPVEPESVAESEASTTEAIIDPIPAVDMMPPDTINDLRAVARDGNVIALNWTAPGDDGVTGTAMSYEMRYGTELITEDNWSLGVMVGGVIVPKIGGSAEELEVSGLMPMTRYYFAIKVKDEAGNESGLSNTVSEATHVAPPNHLVISEVFPDMAGADTSEFVELYNPTDAPINISGYSLQYLSGTATSLAGLTKKNFVTGVVVPAKGFYLVGMWGNPNADMVWSEQLNNAGATVLLVNDQAMVGAADDVNIIDRVTYGAGSGLLMPEGEASPLPGEGRSLERKVLIEGACMSAGADNEFLGNSCDTDNNANDFDVRVIPKGQRLINLIEPRSAPGRVLNESPILSYNPANAQLVFNWKPVIDASGSSSGMTYKIIDISKEDAPVQWYLGSALSFTKTIDEIGREYKASIQSIDKDGLTSEPVELSLAVPGYLNELSFLRQVDASGTQKYVVRLAWETYPFVPVGIARWHLAVFYYNKDAEKFPFLGQLNTGYNWGTSVNIPSPFKTNYANCQGTGTSGAALILPDDATHCSPYFGGVRSQAIDLGLLRDKAIALPVLPQTFGATEPVPGQDYITVAYYFYLDGGNLNSDQRLIAVDKTRYYLSE